MRTPAELLPGLIGAFCLTREELYELTLPKKKHQTAPNLAICININLETYLQIVERSKDKSLIEFAGALLKAELFLIFHFMFYNEDIIKLSLKDRDVYAETAKEIDEITKALDNLAPDIAYLLKWLCGILMNAAITAKLTSENAFCITILEELRLSDPKASEDLADQLVRAGLHPEAGEPDDELFTQSNRTFSQSLKTYFKEKFAEFRGFIFKHGPSLADNPEFKDFFNLLPPAPSAAGPSLFSQAPLEMAKESEEEATLRVLSKNKGSLAYILLRLSKLHKSSAVAATKAVKSQLTADFNNYFSAFEKLLQEANECAKQITDNQGQNELANIMLILIMISAVSQFIAFAKPTKPEESSAAQTPEIAKLETDTRKFMAILLQRIDSKRYPTLHTAFREKFVDDTAPRNFMIPLSSFTSIIAPPARFTCRIIAELLVEAATQTHQRNSFFTAFEIACENLQIKIQEEDFRTAFKQRLTELTERANEMQQQVCSAEKILAEKQAAKKAAREAELAARKDEERQRQFEARQKAHESAEAQGAAGAGPAPEEQEAYVLSKIEIFVQRIKPAPYDRKKLNELDALLAGKNLDLQEQAELQILRAKMLFESLRNSCPEKMPPNISAQVDTLNDLAKRCRDEKIDAYPGLLDLERKKLENKFKKTSKVTAKSAMPKAVEAKNYKDKIPPEVQAILKALQDTSPIPGKFKNQALIFGGFPRDILRKAESKDIDIMCLFDISALSDDQRKNYLTALHADLSKRESVKISPSNMADLYHFTIGKKAFDVKFSDKKTIGEYFKSCDFTCNTACMNLDGEIYGFFPRTIPDIEASLCQPTTDSRQFFDDPVRLLRTLHMTINKGYSLEENFNREFETYLTKFKGLNKEELSAFLKGKIDIDKKPLKPKKIDCKDHFKARLKALLFSVINEKDLKDPDMAKKQKTLAKELGANVLSLVAETSNAAGGADNLSYGMLAYSEVFLECVGHKPVIQAGDVERRSDTPSVFQETVRARVEGAAGAAPRP